LPGQIKSPWQYVIAMGRIRLISHLRGTTHVRQALVQSTHRSYHAPVMLRLHLLSQDNPFPQNAPVLKFILVPLDRALSR